MTARKKAAARHAVDQAPTVRLLEAVRSFTAERKRDALVTTLIKTMLEVLPARAIEYQPRGAHGHEGRLRVHGDNAQAGSASGQQRRMDEASPMRQDMAHYMQRIDSAADGASPEAGIIGHGYSIHPLLDGQGVAGLIAIEHAPGRPVETAIVDALLRIYRNFATVIDDSHRDTLTGLLNRKTFEQSIQSVLLESKRISTVSPDGVEHRREPGSDACHWLAVMDIDHFKRINDTFGHLYGDEVLILLSRLMLQSFRKSDRVYRFGGEEFAVLLSPCTAADVRNVLDRFRLAVQNHDFPQVGQVTISIGVVAVQAQDIPATVVAHADEALYASKHGGRNRVTAYADLAVQAAPQQASSIDLF
ncbi:GGDEF domain-containing protein [Methylibium rhizosphaerae]|jgi:diguanylate cyclase (GGDEF)-like protein|uniref:GGDEF domain-containing protein n=1 Tax=Methylibium rhizosphaerae TaxID=2570323 RepID=UPI00112DA24C|nr:GGDEF domain-containing protein [Methylibium rhizosphaerae]